MKAIFGALLLGVLAGYVVIGIVGASEVSTTLDTLLFTITITGHDFGDRWAHLIQMFTEYQFDAPTTVMYLVGWSLLEEAIKCLFLLGAIMLFHPNTIRMILLMGVSVGLGFAMVEYMTGDHSLDVHTISPMVARFIGHAFFGSMVALWYAWGAFARMRWIDQGARDVVRGWFIHYGGKGMVTLWIIVGVCIAAIFHSATNVAIALGAQSYAILLLLIVGVFLTIYGASSQTERPYGKILREIALMQDIYVSQKELDNLQKHAHQTAQKSSFITQKLRTSRKQVAKK